MKNPNIRKRPANEIHDDEGEDRCFLHTAKKSTPMANSKLYFSTSSADSTKESKKVLFEYDSCKEIQVEHDSKATTTLQTETDISRDARAVRERALAARQSAEALKGDNNNNNEVYKGICNYIDHRAGFRREQTVYGPLRASAHIRVSARYDYQPDICKDYKATGYCGYGDSCKFMHDRGDYKSGWQIDREWEEAEKARKRNLALGGHHAGDDEDDDDDEEEDGNNSLPIACQICKQPVVQAMVTKCRHYFCEHCVLKHQFKKRCFVCDQPTQGTFNVVRDLGKIMAC